LCRSERARSARLLSSLPRNNRRTKFLWRSLDRARRHRAVSSARWFFLDHAPHSVHDGQPISKLYSCSIERGTRMAQANTFEAPHPGSQQMPQWDTGELIEAPVFRWRAIFSMLGPGLVMGAAAIGGGEWLAGPAVTAKYGGALLWV